MLVVTKRYTSILLGLFVLAISACSTTSQKDEGYKGIYSSKSSTGRSLEVPPDLVSPESSNALSIPSLSETSSGYATGSGDDGWGNVLPSSSSGVRFVREGSAFWLEINAKPGELWSQSSSFFKDLGFTFVKDNPVYGVLETNWLENRYDVPTGWFASIIGGFYSIGQMDKYRIRIERTEKENISLLFITHQGLKEISGSDFSETGLSVRWAVREPDPELEAEMLQRFLVFRGIAKTQAKQLTVAAAKNVSDRAKLIQDGSTDTYRVEVSEIFPRTWRRISIALDRMGLIVEDRNRSKGIYFIKTTEDFIKVNKEDKNWLASIFSSSKSEFKVSSFQLSVDEVESKTVISILNDSGENDASKTAYLILTKLKEHLR